MLERVAHLPDALARPLAPLAQSLGTLAHSLGGLTHLLFPQVCVVCRKPLEPAERQLCSGCLAECSPFADSFAGGQAVLRSVNAHFGLRALPFAAWSLYPYQSSGALHDAMHALKYGGLFPLGRLFGRQLGELVLAGGGTDAVEAIVPVPLHPLKRIERTYNQSEAIANGMAEVLNLPVVAGVIERCVHTSSQTGMSLIERRKNMANAFRPPSRSASRRLSGKVLLVDDVLTTGATLVSAASALKKAGVEEVAFAVVAVTEKE